MMAGHWCQEHQTVWFKKGRMKGYAHPIKDGEGETIGWCNEDAQEVAKLPQQPSDTVLPEHQKVIDEATKGKPAPQELGMWWKELGEMIRVGDIDIKKPTGQAMRNAYYAQMLSVLPIKIEEIKGEITKTNKDSKTDNKSQDEGEVSGQDSRETTDEEVPIKNVADLYKWIMSKDKGIKVPRVWIETNFGMSAEGMSDEDLWALYKTILTKMKW